MGSHFFAAGEALEDTGNDALLLASAQHLGGKHDLNVGGLDESTLALMVILGGLRAWQSVVQHRR